MEQEVVPVSKFKATSLALLDKVKMTGQPVLVTKRGEPIALITPPPNPKDRPACLGLSGGKVRSLETLFRRPRTILNGRSWRNEAVAESHRESPPPRPG
jgi:prevent-host-death family protein